VGVGGGGGGGGGGVEAKMHRNSFAVCTLKLVRVNLKGPCAPK